MPVRNALPYLEECLESILNQSYAQWQLIAVDDHSTDASLDLLKQYASKDKRIQCFQNSGLGIIDALTLGYNASNGQFITRMDADDIMPLHKLETMVHSLKEAGLGHIVTGKVKYISTTQLGDGFIKYENWLNALCDHNNHYQEVYKECVIPSPCWMMYRSDFEAIGGFKSSIYPEDYDLCFRMYEAKIKVMPSSEILHIWRDHSERASRNDDNYTDNRFLDLKVHYYLKIDYKSEEKLILWGAGKKGKQIARLLVARQVEFTWVTNNQNKIGVNIYNQILQNESIVEAIQGKASIILAVANEEEQKEILDSIIDQNKSFRIYKFC